MVNKSDHPCLTNSCSQMLYISNSYNTGKRDVLDLLTEPEGVVYNIPTTRVLN